ncbi:MAG: hypothetical protein J5875_01620 [Paludibacteraceae bacterium]|nr:hypothetical protein [Paludibacteraceae bacterium]
MKKLFILLFIQLALCCTSFAANYLTFTAEEDNSEFSIRDHNIKSKIFYSLDNGKTWNKLTAQLVNLAKGEQALLKGEEPDEKPTLDNYSSFRMTGAIAASGSVMSLIDGNGEGKTIPYEYCFQGLFAGCIGLTKAPELPATTLTERCYHAMFRYCPNLTKAPELPATTLAESCYEEMFRDCFSLTKAPELPATTLAKSCYDIMFFNCSNLAIAPEQLPATTLAESCYQFMFYKCTSLTKAPELPATTLADKCYFGMFEGCESLSYVKVAFTEWDDINTIIWLSNVAEEGTFICPKKLRLTYGTSNIPDGWTVIREEDSSTEAVAATEGTTVHTSGLTIFVCNTDADIEVYEVGGKLIGKARAMNGEAQITVPQSGIYLVKAGAQTFKVAL